MKLHVVGLRGARDLMPSDLSGGMTRRVALARAIATIRCWRCTTSPSPASTRFRSTSSPTLIRTLNDALGTTSIIVTYDVSESLKVVDYLYVIADGKLMGEGTPDEMLASSDPYLNQFLKALPDGPVRFHFPAPPIAEELRLQEGPDFPRPSAE